ncbi:exported hypothetical protein [Cupriavidus taiwanensis]|nr:exported hypothetical protein [Cupriavidus taiwanensis]
MIGLAGHASAARAAGAVWAAATPATAMAMERALRATRCLMLDFNYVSFFGMLGNPLAGPAAGDPAGQLCGTQSVRCRAKGG